METKKLNFNELQKVEGGHNDANMVSAYCWNLNNHAANCWKNGDVEGAVYWMLRMFTDDEECMNQFMGRQLNT